MKHERRPPGPGRVAVDGATSVIRTTLLLEAADREALHRLATAADVSASAWVRDAIRSADSDAGRARAWLRRHCVDIKVGKGKLVLTIDATEEVNNPGDFDAAVAAAMKS